jgi:hypothetical protein
MRWPADEAHGAGVEIICNGKMEKPSRGVGVIALPQFKSQAVYLEDADGARSTVGILFGLGRHRKVLTCPAVR